MNLPSLGVGLSFFSGIEELVQEKPSLVQVLEIEPQTMWYHTKGNAEEYRMDEGLLKQLAAIRCPKILHGVGFPVGGSRPPDAGHVPLLLKMISQLEVPWMSEHLSFNRARGPGGEFQTGFLLPPRQTAEGAQAASESIKSMAGSLPIPFAVEVGVNYFRPRNDELNDGEFINSVLQGCDCGLLLDLHNIWANEKNGRQSVKDFLNQIPLDRIWELHLAGGTEHEGYWLDAHSGEIPSQLVELARHVIPTFPNLRAIVFELFPSYLESFGLEAMRTQLKILHSLWDLRPKKNQAIPSGTAPKILSSENKQIRIQPGPAEWEDVLGALVTGQKSSGRLAEDLSKDPGIAIIQDIIGRFRFSIVLELLKLTCRLLVLQLGREKFSLLVADYWQKVTPMPFSSDEAERFADYVESLQLGVPYLNEVVAYEKAVINSQIYGKKQIVEFPYNPLPVLRALAENKTPMAPDKGNFEIEIRPDDISQIGHDADSKNPLTWVYHLH